MQKLVLLFALGLVVELSAAECKQPAPCDAFRYATAANDVYHDHPAHSIGCAGNEVTSNQKIGDGFYAEVYGDQNSGFIIAFRGTQESQDWIDDLLQGLKGSNALNEQFRDASDYINDVKDVLDNCFPNATKTLVGHSLGGALAQYAATLLGNGYNTVTFNPAGLLPDDANKGNAKCVYNYVHGNDILYKVVNPLLKQLKANGCASVASGYVGDTLLLTPGTPRTFPDLHVNCDDLGKMAGVLQDLNNELPSWAQGGWGQKLWFATELPKLTEISKIKAFQQVLEAIAPEVATSWSSLSDELNAKPPETIPWWDLVTMEKWRQEHGQRLEAKATEFFAKLGAAAGSLGSSGNDHLLGEKQDEPGHYNNNSVLGLLEQQCKDSGGTPTVIGGYSRVPGGCFGNLPVDDQRPANFLDQVGEALKQNGDTIQHALDNYSTAADILKAFGGSSGPISDVLSILSVAGKIDEIGGRCSLALASGSEQDFVNAINDGLKFALGKLAEVGGAALGTAIGGPIGTIIGGWLGGTLGEAAYDEYLKEFVTKNISETLFALLCPEMGKGGDGSSSNPPTDPSTNNPSTNNPGANNPDTTDPGKTDGNSGDTPGLPGVEVVDPGQLIKPGPDNQARPPSGDVGSKHTRDKNYRKISK
ncbi:MAG: Mbeg1-like protein [Verrucomicrobiota bacterium]